MKRYLLLSVLMSLVLLLIAVPSLNAQAIWTHQPTERGVALEALKPTFAENDGVKFSTSALFFSGFTRIGEHFRVIGELPVVHYGFEPSQNQQGNENISETAVGNPYLGMQYRTTEQRFTADVGVRFPVMSEDKPFAEQTGFYSDLERQDAFIPDALGFIGNGQYRYRFENGLFAGVRGGGSFLINTQKDEGEDASDFYLNYGLFAGYEAERFNITGNFDGRFLTTHDEGGFGENSLHLLAFSGNYKAGKISPGLMVKVPLDKDLSDVVDFVVGLQVAVNLQ